MISGTETQNQTILMLAIILTAAFYFLMIKPFQDAKAKQKSKGGKNIESTMASQGGSNRPDGPHYDNIINDFPTYTRQVK